MERTRASSPAWAMSVVGPVAGWNPAIPGRRRPEPGRFATDLPLAGTNASLSIREGLISFLTMLL